MAIRVNDPAYKHLPDEKSAVVGDSEGRILIHPWSAGDSGPEYPRVDSRVGVALGCLKKNGEPKNEDGDDYEIHIFDRADFVEALLAVFPELVRVDE